MAHKGYVQWLTGDYRRCTGDDGEHTGGDWGRRGIFIRTGVFRISSEN